MEWGMTGSQLGRILSFDTSVYGELRYDSRSTLPALAIPVVAIFLFGLGGFLWSVVEFEADWEFFWKSAIVGSLLGLAFWLVWIGVAYFLLAQVHGERIDPQEFVRVMGPASAPLVLGFFMFIPQINFAVGLVAVALLFTSCTLAAQHGLGVSPQRAVAANAAGFAIWAGALAMILTTDNPFAPGIFVFEWAEDVVIELWEAIEEWEEAFGRLS